MNQITTDEIKKFDLKIDQPHDGYRFSIDALLLADFARPPAAAKVVDLGTGCGVIPLLLARGHAAISITGIESNQEMALLADGNVALNRLENRIDIVADDILNIRNRFPVSSFDLVISNPPYRAAANGRTSPKPGRDTARHESTATISDFLAAAKYLVKPSGRICFVYHPGRLPEFISRASELNLALLRLRMVHGSQDAPAKIFLAELAKGRKGDTDILPTIFIYNSDGTYTEEAGRIQGESYKKRTRI